MTSIWNTLWREIFSSCQTFLSCCLQGCCSRFLSMEAKCNCKQQRGCLSLPGFPRWTWGVKVKNEIRKVVVVFGALCCDVASLTARYLQEWPAGMTCRGSWKVANLSLCLLASVFRLKPNHLDNFVKLCWINHLFVSTSGRGFCVSLLHGLESKPEGSTTFGSISDW